MWHRFWHLFSTIVFTSVSHLSWTWGNFFLIDLTFVFTLAFNICFYICFKFKFEFGNLFPIYFDIYIHFCFRLSLKFDNLFKMCFVYFDICFHICFKFKFEWRNLFRIWLTTFFHVCFESVFSSVSNFEFSNSFQIYFPIYINIWKKKTKQNKKKKNRFLKDLILNDKLETIFNMHLNQLTTNWLELNYILTLIRLVHGGAKATIQKIENFG